MNNSIGLLFYFRLCELFERFFYFRNEIQYNFHVIKDSITPTLWVLKNGTSVWYCFVIVVFDRFLHRSSFIYLYTDRWLTMKNIKIKNYDRWLRYYVLSWMVTIPNKMIFVHSQITNSQIKGGCNKKVMIVLKNIIAIGNMKRFC